MTVSKSDREIYSPSALQTNYIALWILSITFFAITLLVLFELIQNYHIYRKEKKMNLLIVYRGMILITCFFNTFSRTIVALFDIPWKTQGLLYFFVYIINNFFQFCIFAFFILFFIKFWLFITNQEKINYIVNGVYLILLLSILAVSSIFCGLLDHQTITKSQWEKRVNLFRGFMYLSVVTICTVSAVFLYRTLIKKRLTIQRLKRIRLFMILILIYAIIFLFRGIYDTLDGFGKNKLNTIIMSQNNGNKNRFFIVYTIWYIFFEGIPVLVLVFAFHKQIKLELKLFNFLEPKETGNTYFYSSVIDTNEYSGLNSSTNYINNSSVEDDFETEDDSVFSTSEN
ncbi:hypothetical protein M0812_02428 [Anaeramoeba flamelloides]|uniref:THH1/TOM1/TOM3 domain-containing protein n=1 Tax=Anaeramoeba flamelloides TaxID=1746091 RepID=A0AAV7YLY5_9EUKA|nr:hypothetical protein M0812_02428 [Anaeramoeba flamelloides]